MKKSKKKREGEGVTSVEQSHPYHRRLPQPSRSRHHGPLSFSPSCFLSPPLLHPPVFSLPFRFSLLGLLPKQPKSLTLFSLVEIPLLRAPPSPREVVTTASALSLFSLSQLLCASPTIKMAFLCFGLGIWTPFPSCTHSSYFFVLFVFSFFFVFVFVKSEVVRC